LAAAPDSQRESMLEDGNQKQLKRLGFNRIWDPCSIGTENAQNTLQVVEKKLVLRHGFEPRFIEAFSNVQLADSKKA
jgi:hypothetical protein